MWMLLLKTLLTLWALSFVGALAALAYALEPSSSHPEQWTGSFADSAGKRSTNV